MKSRTARAVPHSDGVTGTEILFRREWGKYGMGPRCEIRQAIHSDIILEQLEERIVLDGAVEAASAEDCRRPDEGTGIFDGSVSKIAGQLQPA